jgi:D-xylose 1-dehydrogenase (NADP+, D-xylono-1,5-lactone-forming)
MADPENYRNDPAMGGGALLDVGIYTVNIARWLIGEEPIMATAMGVPAESGIDASVSGVLAFPSGALAQVQCSFASAEHQMLDLTGTRGVIEAPRPFTAWRNDESAIILTQGDQRSQVIFAPADPYAIMIEHFSACVRDEADPFLPVEDAIGTLRVLDALRRSMISGRTERV